VKAPSFDQFSKAWRLMIGSGVFIYAVVTPAPTGALPYILVGALGLMGLSITWPWENKKNGSQEAG
jgi:hypothetical protein